MTRLTLSQFGLASLLLISTAGYAEERMIWPELPESGFIAGKAATKEDVAAGQAVFSMDGKSEGPVDIEIPQYAIWTDGEGAEHPVVVTQAESAPGGLQIVGLRTADGSEIAATLPEVRLLGSKKPS